MKERNELIGNIMEIDSFMFPYIAKQLEIFKRDLGKVFGISETMLVDISSKDNFGKDYYFIILAFEPNIGRKLTALQSDTWRYYAETRLIIEEKTFLRGNRYKENGIFTGDIYIPIKVQKEMMSYYYGYDI